MAARNGVVTKQGREDDARGCPHHSQRIGFCLRAYFDQSAGIPDIGRERSARWQHASRRGGSLAKGWCHRSSADVGNATGCPLARETPLARDREPSRTSNSLTNNAGGVDPFKEIGSTLEVVEETQLLTKLAKTGLLSKAERAGVKLADLEPLLLFAEENGLVGLLGDLNDELLPLLPLLVRLAPLGLPVVSLALGLGPLNFLLAIASFGGAFVVTGLPDDSVTDVALQTLIAVPLATLFPVLFGGLGLVSSKLA